MWNYAYTVPENKKVRVIVHTDCKNEADDQYAVAHHLMTPRFDVKGLVAGHFWKNPQQYGELGTAQASYDEIIKVMDLMGLKDQYPVKLGAPRALEDEHTPIDSEGARFIIEEAMKEDKTVIHRMPGRYHRCCIRTSDEAGNRRANDSNLDRWSGLSKGRI